MNLNLCAACAAPLSDHDIQSCVRCQTRYCSRVECIWQGCYRQHNRVPCEDIAAAGGAERYHADKKYKEAVATAVAACAAETNEQTCYICYMGDDEDDEGLVRGCACRGTSGYAHVSCLAEQAKIMAAHNFEPNVKGSTWDRWRACRICGQHYHGVVKHALGWACWKTYVGRSEDYAAYQVWAMSRLGKDVSTIGSPERRLELFEAQMANGVGLNEQEILANLSNAAGAYYNLRRYEKCMEIERNLFSRSTALLGIHHAYTLTRGFQLASSLMRFRKYAEAKNIMLELIPESRASLGDDHDLTIGLRANYGKLLCDDTPSNDAALLDDLREAVAVLEDVEWRSQRLYGDAHPETTENQLFLRDARKKLARAEGARARRELRRHQFRPIQPPCAASNGRKLDPQWRHTRREELEQKLREHEAQIARLTAQIAAMKQEAPPPEEVGDAGG